MGCSFLELCPELRANFKVRRNSPQDCSHSDSIRKWQGPPRSPPGSVIPGKDSQHTPVEAVVMVTTHVRERRD